MAGVSPGKPGNVNRFETATNKLLDLYAMVIVARSLEESKDILLYQAGSVDLAGTELARELQRVAGDMTRDASQVLVGRNVDARFASDCSKIEKHHTEYNERIRALQVMISLTLGKDAKNDFLAILERE